MKVGYRRVSTVEQKFDRQELGELDKLFEEKVSGSNAERLALNEMMKLLCCNINCCNVCWIFSNSVFFS